MRVLFGVVVSLLVLFEGLVLWGEELFVPFSTMTVKQDVVKNLTVLLHNKGEALEIMRKELDFYNKSLGTAQFQHTAARKEFEEKVAVSNTMLQQAKVTLDATRNELTKVKQKNERLEEELQYSYSNYLLHTPKTGGYSLFQMLRQHRAELSMIKPPNVCNHGNQNVEHAQNWTQCWLHATESFLSKDFARRFLVVRNPLHHVVSMYHHCTESKDHSSRAHLMPSTLDEWLDPWVQAQAEGRTIPEFRCYNPIKLQSRVAGFLERDPQRDLTYLYDVVGLTTELSKTACLMSISIHKKIPKRCDCSVQRSISTEQELRNDHGVAHHGDTFNLTNSQQNAIMNLTARDAVLYKVAETAFWEKVKKVETKYSIELC